MSSSIVTLPCLLLALAVTLVVHRIAIILYRLAWHPLARFPGPKLAACSSLYGAYYDLLDKRSLCRQVTELHRIYGPVIRIAPNELHINDLEAYYKIFRVGSNFAKAWDFYNSRAIEGSLLTILDTPSAKKRKDAYARYFAPDAISKIEPRVHTAVDKFLSILQSSGNSGTAVDLSMGFRAVTADVITDYSCQQEFGALDTPGFQHPMLATGDKLLVFAQWGLYFRSFFYSLDVLTDYLPDRVLRFLSPEVLEMRRFQQNCAQGVQNVKKQEYSPDSSRPTIFNTILNPSANKGRAIPSDQVLTSEAVLMLLAGTDTTANTLSVATYYCLRNTKIGARLVKELHESLPDITDTSALTAQRLRSLPYLSACIKEALRISCGAPGRLPRIVPESGLVVGEHFIPPGTIVSHSNYVYHMDASVFPDPGTYRPERWLVADPAPLERQLLAFSKGSRACLGIHMANSEMLIALARLFRTLEFELAGTTDEDMRWRDYSVCIFQGHLKIKIKENRQGSEVPKEDPEERREQVARRRRPLSVHAGMEPVVELVVAAKERIDYGFAHSDRSGFWGPVM